MTQRPILMSTPMIQAILQGRKTMTRRAIKPQPDFDTAKRRYSSDERNWYKVGEPTIDKLFGLLGLKTPNGVCYTEPNINCPYGEIGDILWVRETLTNDAPIDEPPIWVYKADAPNYPLNSGQRWKPSIFMPKEACRLFLRITNVKVERLQDISEEDAKAEGVEETPNFRYKHYICGNAYDAPTAYVSFCTLWQKINGEESLNANPFVWCIAFERTEKPS